LVRPNFGTKRFPPYSGWKKELGGGRNWNGEDSFLKPSSFSLTFLTRLVGGRTPSFCGSLLKDFQTLLPFKGGLKFPFFPKFSQNPLKRGFLGKNLAFFFGHGPQKFLALVFPNVLSF